MVHRLFFDYVPGVQNRYYPAGSRPCVIWAHMGDKGEGWLTTTHCHETYQPLRSFGENSG